MEEDAKKEDETLLPFRLATLFGNFVGYFKNLDNSKVFPGRYNKAWISTKKVYRNVGCIVSFQDTGYYCNE